MEIKDDCSICFEPLSKGSVFTTECKHSFHYQCLKDSSNFGNLNCPLCRHDIPETRDFVKRESEKKPKTETQRRSDPVTLSRKVFGGVHQILVEGSESVSIQGDGKIGTNSKLKVEQRSDTLIVKGKGNNNVNIGNSYVSIGGNGIMTTSNFNSNNFSTVFVNGRQIQTGGNSNSRPIEEEPPTEEYYLADNCLISAIKCSGCADISLDEKFVCKSNMNISVSGTGKVTMPRNISIDNCVVNLSGSGDAIFSNGRFKSITATLVGSGDIKLRNSEAENATIQLTGSGDINGLIISKYGSINVMGSGDVDVVKKDRNVRIDKNRFGSGSISVDTY